MKYRSWPRMHHCFHQMYIWSKFKDSVLFGYLETELNTKSEYFANIQMHAKLCQNMFPPNVNGFISTE